MPLHQTTNAGAMTTDALQQTAGVAADAESLIGFDCIIIPGAQGPTANSGVPEKTQEEADLKLKITDGTNAPQAWPPAICGHNKGIGIGETNLTEVADFTHFDGETSENLTVCSRMTPFMIEFLSDNTEGLGSEASDSEYQDADQSSNRGFSLTHKQLAC